MQERRYGKTRNIFSIIGNAAQKTAFLFIAFIKKAAAAIKSVLNRLLNKKSGGYLDDASENTQVFDSTDIRRSAKEKPFFRFLRGASYGTARNQEHVSRAVPHILSEHLSGEGREHINMFCARRHHEKLFLGITLSSVKLILIAVFMIGAAGLGAVVGVAKGYMETTPKLDTGKIEEQAETSYIYDCNGSLITAYTGVENRDMARADEIPLMLRDAFIAIEDVRFEYHSGVDIKRLVSSFISNISNSSVQGGSTITQQLIKNRLLTFERTYKRKIQEAYLAMQLEQTYSKEEILAAYLNTIHLGGSNYGVKAAALDYFGKSLNALTLRECAMLAGITQYPYQYNPRRCYYITEQPEVVNKRTDEVLRKMYTAGFISLEQYNYALEDTVFIIEESRITQMYEMPYFVEYAVYDVITHMLKLRNMQDTKQNRSLIETELRTNGYKIYTTVDPEIQKTVEQSLAKWEEYPRLANSGDNVVRDESSGIVTEIVQPQAAAVVVEQSTGELKAVVGGRTTPTAKKTLNRAYQNKMPVGSSIKPIAVYAPAIDKGFSDGTVIPNLPLPIEGWKLDDGTYGYPAGGASKYGPVTLRSGIVNSLNSATAYLLMNNVLIQDSYNYLVQMGINPIDINQTGSGLALGSSGITPVELAGAYAAIANGGVYLEPLSFRYVEDKDGS
ncbi:MAG: transglycosylase domain-containing protein, partial [Christensenellales bacterium]